MKKVITQKVIIHFITGAQFFSEQQSRDKGPATRIRQQARIA